jgi:hypothetical protein
VCAASALLLQLRSRVCFAPVYQKQSRACACVSVGQRVGVHVESGARPACVRAFLCRTVFIACLHPRPCSHLARA